jgi:Na+/H+ antiporter NhaC
MLILSRRDFGLMYKKELSARTQKTEKNETHKNKQKSSSAWNGILPVGFVIIGTITGLFLTGWDSEYWHNPAHSLGSKLSYIIGQGDSFKALLWASFGAVIIAIAMSIGKKLLSLNKSIDAMIGGFKSMLTAILILTLAWALALLTEHLHTAEFISHAMQSASMNPRFIPAISFVISAVVAFSTGTSWGTMAIMYPLILPATWLMTTETGMSHDVSMMIFNNVVSTVIAGSVLGDHCSPISDTTILSSLASGCKHIDHVKTQMPYALTVGIVALVLGTIPAAFGVPFFVLIIFNLGVLFLIIRIFGKKLPITKLSVKNAVN